MSKRGKGPQKEFINLFLFCRGRANNVGNIQLYYLWNSQWVNLSGMQGRTERHYFAAMVVLLVKT